MRTRRRLDDTEAAARDESHRGTGAVDRAYALLLSEPQIIVDWAAASDEPEIIGDPSLVTAPIRRTACSPSAPGSSPTRRRDMERAVDALRARGAGFAMTRHDARRPHRSRPRAQIIGGRAILRLREVSGIKRELAELSAAPPEVVDDAAACAP